MRFEQADQDEHASQEARRSREEIMAHYGPLKAAARHGERGLRRPR
jgi:hypothetical protein